MGEDSREMACTYCETVLPPGALFCGECGRAVTGSPVISLGLSSAPPPSIGHRQAFGSGQAPLRPTVPHPVPPLVIPRSDGAATVVCEQCGFPMSEDDIFCGECGFVSRAASEDFGRSRDTAIIQLSPPRAPTARPQPAPLVDRLPDFPAAEQSDAPSVIKAPPVSPGVPPVLPTDLVPPPMPSPAGSTPQSSAITALPFDDSVDLEATRISRPGRAGERFVLQFSTGESFTVYGSGLIGRNPRSEPGENFDQLVRVLDPSRSVSKVHLQFGQEAGRFWIMDRFSGNGTIAREPESEPVRCQPEKRFRIGRGTRVDIGEQFFIVS